MRVGSRHFRTISWDAGTCKVEIIDQTKLPHAFEMRRVATLAEAATAIADMWVRGAPLIGVTAAYGVALALRENPSDAALAHACERLAATRPTAINLAWALERMYRLVVPLPAGERAAAALAGAERIAEEDIATSAAIGDHGLALVRAAAEIKPAGEPVNILTHCNAGWLAAVDWGTHTVIVDNAGGHLMQIGRVDLCIVGTDRTTATGDVCNKIGTYLKALAAQDNRVPFYVAAPSSSIDFTLSDGLAEVPIETRAAAEVTHMTGRMQDGRIASVQITPDGSPALNHGFDITPARLVTGLITERGVVAATEEALAKVFPERVVGKK